MVESFTITRDSGRSDTAVITTGSMLDNNNAHELVNMITLEYESGTKFVIIDMKQLEFLSSAGVGSILGTVELLRELGGDIVLCNLSPTIHHILSVLDVTDYLTIKSSNDEALECCMADRS